MPSRYSVEIVIRHQCSTLNRLDAAKTLAGSAFLPHLLSPIMKTSDRDAIAWLVADGLREKCSQFNLK